MTAPTAVDDGHGVRAVDDGRRTSGGRGGGDLLGPARRRLAPVWEALLAEGLRDGRFTTRGLPPAVRPVAVLGLVAVVALLASLLAQDLWRTGDLVTVTSLDQPRFLPQALLPVVVLAMALGWAVMLLGAALSAPSVQVGAAALFLVVNGTIGKPLVVTTVDATGLVVGRQLVAVGYFGVPALLLLLALLRRVPRVQRRVLPVVAVLLVLACAAMFGGILWMQEAAEVVRRPDDIPNQLSGAVLQILNLVLPLIFVSQLALLDVSYAVAVAAVSTTVGLSLRSVRVAFVALVGGKLLWQVLHDPGRFGVVADRPWAFVRTVTMLLAALALFLAARRLYRAASDTPVEGVLYGGALLLGLPLFVVDVLLTIGAAVALRVGVDASVQWLDWAPTDPILEYGDVVLASVVLVAALTALLVRPTPLRRRVALGAVVVAGWAAVSRLLDLVATDPGVLYSLADVMVTAAVAAWAAARWRTLGARHLCQLAALVVFVWLASTRGDVFTVVGEWLGLPDVLLLVVGISFLLLTDSAFTRTGGKRVPRSARSLLWLGYLVLNLALVNWVEITHSIDFGEASAAGAVFFLGIPLAAWLVAVRRFSVPDPDAPASTSVPDRAPAGP